jgi:hypothetical protein
VNKSTKKWPIRVELTGIARPVSSNVSNYLQACNHGKPTYRRRRRICPGAWSATMLHFAAELRLGFASVVRFANFIELTMPYCRAE